MVDYERVTRGVLPHWYKPGYAHFVTYRLAGSIPQVRLKEWKDERQRCFDLPIPTGRTKGQHHDRAHKLFFKSYDDFLDSHANIDWLKQDAVASVVRENLYHHHGHLFELIAWCVMPNHVHIVIQPFERGLTDAGRLSSPDAGSVGNGFKPDAGSVGNGFKPDAGSIGNVEDAASICSDLGPDAANVVCLSDEVSDRTSILSRIMHSLKSYTANRANEILGRTGKFWQRESYDHWIRDTEELERIVNYIQMNPVKAGLCDKPHEWKYSSAYDRYCKDGSMCGTVGTLKDDWRR